MAVEMTKLTEKAEQVGGASHQLLLSKKSTVGAICSSVVDPKKIFCGSGSDFLGNSGSDLITDKGGES